MKRLLPTILCFIISTILYTSCARMGQPDGGWYDETPPKVLYATPKDGGTNVGQKKISIVFNEYVKIENATENVIISPPQIEMPEIKAAGKRILVELKDTLKENTTYTVDFSDAITDNNESNPLGNYTYSFSTGSEIDTMQVGGYVLEAQTLEPVKGILVGLYPVDDNSAKNDALSAPDSNAVDTLSYSDMTIATLDSINTETIKRGPLATTPFMRVARTDAFGHFVVVGVKPGKYNIAALQDMDGNYTFSQKGEMIAYSNDVIVPSMFEDVRQDTIWRDSLHIKSIDRIKYNHYIPDDIVLRAFNEEITDRFLLKRERTEPDRFTLYFTHGDSLLPEIEGLNFDAKDAFVIESNLKHDTITYWLRDTALINNDSLMMAFTYRITDTLGNLIALTDTAEVAPKTPYEKRRKALEKEMEKWQKQQDKKKKKGEPYDSIMPKKPLKIEKKSSSTMNPDQNVILTSPTPLQEVDTAKIHLYVKHDSIWYNARYEMEQRPDINIRTYEIRAEWRPELEYSLEMDSAAFCDIYGNVSEKKKEGLKIRALKDYATVMITLQGMKDSTAVVQLLDQSDKVVKETVTNNGMAEFFYVEGKTYYLRMYIDSNNNGIWDTGLYDTDTQPEMMYYYPEKLECKANWDVNRTWNPTALALNMQKPKEITKQKESKKRTIRSKNADRAKKLGIPEPDSKIQ